MISAICASPPMRAKGYLAALPALLRQKAEEMGYWLYVTDALRAAFGLNLRYADVLPEKPDGRKRAEPDPVKNREKIRAKLRG